MLRKGHSRYKLLREVYTYYLCLFLLIIDLKLKLKQAISIGKRPFFYIAIVVYQQCSLQIFFVMLRGIESFCFLFLCNPHGQYHVDHFKDDEGNNKAIGNSECHSF